MSTSEFTRPLCSQCGAQITRSRGEINRALKKGGPMFCSPTCWGLSRRVSKEHADAVRRATGRAYYAKNKESFREYGRARRQMPEVQARKRERYLRYYDANREAINASRRTGPRPKKDGEEKRLHLKDYRLRYDYGISLAQFMEMYRAQGGLCAICQEPHDDHGRDSLGVDHCHETGKVRGLLCRHCNLWIGMLGEPAKALEFAHAMAAYLTSPE